MNRLLATKSEGAGLIVHAISFQDFQPMWSQITNVTDRQTTCDRKTALCTMHSASRGKNDSTNNSVMICHIARNSELNKPQNWCITDWARLPKILVSSPKSVCANFHQYQKQRVKSTTDPESVTSSPTSTCCLLTINKPTQMFCGDLATISRYN